MRRTRSPRHQHVGTGFLEGSRRYNGVFHLGASAHAVSHTDFCQNGQLIAHSDDEQTKSLGKGADLLFRELRVEFVVHDRRWEHDRLTVTTILSGGEKKLEIIHDQKGEPGDSATYTTLVQFV